MQCRRAGTEDTDTLRRLARESEAHWGYDETFMDTFDRMFNITGPFISEHPVFVFMEEEEVLAQQHALAFWGMIPDRDRGELEFFYISLDCLNRGYGRRMWDHMTGWCRENGIRELSFVTSWEATGFYEKMGAVQDGEARSVIDGRPIPHFTYKVS